jgi:hypothetical protein
LLTGILIPERFGLSTQLCCLSNQVDHTSKSNQRFNLKLLNLLTGQQLGFPYLLVNNRLTIIGS